MRVYLKKTLTGFVPADAEAGDACRKYKVGEVYRAEIVKPRSFAHHKLCFALLVLTYGNLPEEYEGRWPTFDAFRYAVAEAAGQVEEYVSIDGEIRTRARSLSYDSIPDEVEFGRVMAAMMTVCTKILDLSEPELAAEVSRYADEGYGR